MSMLSSLLKKLKKSQPLKSPIAGVLIQQLLSDEDKQKVIKASSEILTAISVARMIVGDEDKYKDAEIFITQVRGKINE